MCICLHKPAGVEVPRATLLNCYQSNRDGAGFAFVDDGKLHVKKGFFNFDQFYAAYEPHAKKETIVHFRIATHGPTDADNCHPWTVEGEKYSFALVHNGILPCHSSKDKSDTGVFVEHVLGPQLRRDPWFLDHEGMRWMLGASIGSFNKMVVLRSDGRVYIINEEQGQKDGDVWYSNGGYKGYGTWGKAGAWYRDGFARGRDYDMMGEEDWRAQRDRDHEFDRRERIKHALSVPPHRPLTEAEMGPDLDIATGGSVGGVGLMCRLTRKERRRLFTLAREAFVDEGEKLTDLQALAALRTMFRDENPWTCGLSDDEIDGEIVKRNYRGI